MRIREITEGVGRITKQNQTVDVGPDEVTKQAAKFGNKVDKDGRPPTLSKKVKGKSTNVLFNLGMVEGYTLQLERDKELLLLNITDTKTGKRTEVRGKPGYESGGYDPKDSLHILLDKVGKSVDISQLMNGEPVGINPKHPTGANAKDATDKAYSESLEEALGEIAPNTEIYVDMDGVLADFFGEWSKSQGVDNWKDIKDPAKAIGDIKSIEDFWLNLPILPKAKELLGLIKQVKGKYKICTSPLADDPRSEPHKREWVKKNLAFFPPEEVIVTHNKPQFAKQKDDTPNILIDDYGVNINAWEEAGGIGFKYKDYKFNRTAKAIKNKIEDPVEENLIEKGMDCPPATQDLALNTKNRDATLKNFNYGPLNVDEPGDYWEKIAKYGKTDVKAAKASNCGNCVAFDISPRMDDCMPGETSDEFGRLGYCWMHHFKCHSARSCHTWAKGGPIEDDKKSLDWQKRGEDKVEENFADGKKKGKSRPGRVKKSGASCNGTVTQLRKRAKKASGEKAKMYHWCANMKGGKK